MKYETPEMTTLMPAINAIQGPIDTQSKDSTTTLDSSSKEHVAAYADWE
jgi:hypothetical protein